MRKEREELEIEKERIRLEKIDLQRAQKEHDKALKTDLITQVLLHNQYIYIYIYSLQEDKQKMAKMESRSLQKKQLTAKVHIY